MGAFEIARSATIQADPARPVGGSMVITSSSAERIDVELTFLKPWQASNDVTFTFAPSGTATDVTWRMSGEQRGMAAIFGRLFNLDKLLGKDFEKGLARLKAVAEAPS